MYAISKFHDNPSPSSVVIQGYLELCPPARLSCNFMRSVLALKFNERNLTMRTAAATHAIPFWSVLYTRIAAYAVRVAALCGKKQQQMEFLVNLHGSRRFQVALETDATFCSAALPSGSRNDPTKPPSPLHKSCYLTSLYCQTKDLSKKLVDKIVCMLKN